MTLLPAAIAAAGIKWGADLKKLGICVALGAALWVIPPPAGVALKAWHLLAIFLSTIAGIITTPLPLGAVAMLGLGASMLTGTLTFAAASWSQARLGGAMPTSSPGALLSTAPRLPPTLASSGCTPAPAKAPPAPEAPGAAVTMQTSCTLRACWRGT